MTFQYYLPGFRIIRKIGIIGGLGCWASSQNGPDVRAEREPDSSMNTALFFKVLLLEAQYDRQDVAFKP